MILKNRAKLLRDVSAAIIAADRRLNRGKALVIQWERLQRSLDRDAQRAAIHVAHQFPVDDVTGILVDEGCKKVLLFIDGRYMKSVAQI